MLSDTDYLCPGLDDFLEFMETCQECLDDLRQALATAHPLLSPRDRFLGLHAWTCWSNPHLSEIYPCPSGGWMFQMGSRWLTELAPGSMDTPLGFAPKPLALLPAQQALAETVASLVEDLFQAWWRQSPHAPVVVGVPADPPMRRERGNDLVLPLPPKDRARILAVKKWFHDDGQSFDRVQLHLPSPETVAHKTSIQQALSLQEQTQPVSGDSASRSRL